MVSAVQQVWHAWLALRSCDLEIETATVKLVCLICCQILPLSCAGLISQQINAQAWPQLPRDKHPWLLANESINREFHVLAVVCFDHIVQAGDLVHQQDLLRLFAVCRPLLHAKLHLEHDVVKNLTHVGSHYWHFLARRVPLQVPWQSLRTAHAS